MMMIVFTAGFMSLCTGPTLLPPVAHSRLALCISGAAAAAAAVLSHWSNLTLAYIRFDLPHLIYSRLALHVGYCVHWPWPILG